MPETAAPLAELIRSLLPDRVLGLRMTVDADAGGKAFLLPVFAESTWERRLDGAELPPIPAALLEALGKSSDTAVLIDAFAPSRTARLRLETERGVHHGWAAVIHQALTVLPPGTTVCFMAPASIATPVTFEAPRREIEDHGLSWLVFLGGTALSGVHHAVQFLLIVCTVGPSRDEDVVRLVDLRGLDPGRWRSEVRGAAKRGGGEVGRSVVISREQLRTGAWLYERFTRAYAASRADTAKLGELRPLEDLIEPLRIGLTSARTPVHLQPVGEDDVEPPPGMIPVIGGREITKEGIVTPGRFWAERNSVPEDLRVQPGDVLFRSITRGPGLMAAVVQDGLDATFEHQVLRLRWKEEIPEQVRQLLVEWLATERAGTSLDAATMGGYIRVTPSALLRLEVPYPREEIVAALASLADLEAWYRARAEAARVARQAVFASKTYAEAVPLLLDAQRAERERVTAAEDSQRFEYRVRNYFPHPIALRREGLSVLPHGKDRVEKVLECAEHLAHYLALCGLVQLRALRPNLPLPSRCLADVVRGTELRMTWGTSWSVLNEAVAATKRSAEGLELPFPQLTMLRDSIVNAGTPSARAEAALRAQRNSESHLRRMPDSALEDLSKSLSAALDEMLGAVSFLADLPLVFVRDYRLDGVTERRTAQYEYLRGASVIFERRWHEVEREMPRDCLGLLGHDGHFHQLGPWMVLHTCDVCKRPEVFVFNAKESSAITYVAMESGHPSDCPGMAEAFDRLFRAHSLQV